MIRSDATFDGTFHSPRISTTHPASGCTTWTKVRTTAKPSCACMANPRGYLFRHLIAALADASRRRPRSYGLRQKRDAAGPQLLAAGPCRQPGALRARARSRSHHARDARFRRPGRHGLAARHPDRIRRIVSANGPTPFGQPDLVERLNANGRAAPWFQWIARAAADTLETVLGQLGFNILSTLKLNGFENHAVINDTWIAAYGAPFAQPEDCAGAIGWAAGLPLARTGSRCPMRRRCARYATSPRSRSGETPTERSAPNTSCRSSRHCFRPRPSNGWRASGTTASRMRPTSLRHASPNSSGPPVECVPQPAARRPAAEHGVRGRLRNRARTASRHRMIRVTPRPRGSAIASGVLPSILITWMSPLKSCPFSV